MSARGIIVPFEPWRLDVRKNTDIATPFNFSVLGRCVKAWVGPLTQIEDGPHAQYDRHIGVGFLGRNRSILEVGSRWPYWIAVVSGDRSKVRFPRIPDDFDPWFDQWVKTESIKVVADWRAEARCDGCADDEIWRETHKMAADLRAMMAEECAANLDGRRA